VHEALQVTPIPACAGALWEAFIALNKRRRSDFAIHHFTIGELLDYARGFGFAWNPWELDTLLALDSAVVRRLRTRENVGGDDPGR
jgi:hypothetical protein